VPKLRGNSIVILYKAMGTWPIYISKTDAYEVNRQAKRLKYEILNSGVVVNRDVIVTLSNVLC
jgi:hypothetical protein